MNCLVVSRACVGTMNSCVLVHLQLSPIGYEVLEHGEIVEKYSELILIYQKLQEFVSNNKYIITAAHSIRNTKNISKTKKEFRVGGGDLSLKIEKIVATRNPIKSNNPIKTI